MRASRLRMAAAGSLAAVACAFVLIVAAYGSSPVTASNASPQPAIAVYNESGVLLPGFDPLYGYVYGNNCEPNPGFGCGKGAGNYSQVPVLANSPEQPPGIYYVDNASELVAVPVGSGPVHVVAPVTLLHQNYSQYSGMIANEFFLPDGYDEALFYGTETGSSNLTVESVNLSTGAVSLRPTGIGADAENQQVTAIGPDEVLVVSTRPGCVAVICNATAVDVNLSSGAERLAARLPFFEANNLYWVPALRAVFNVAAHGSQADAVEQWDAATNGTLTLVANISVDRAEAVDWADGIAFNGSAIAYSAGNSGYSATYVLPLVSGRITNAGEVRYVAVDRSATVGAQWINGQQYVYPGPWVMGGLWHGTQYLFDPWTGATIATNEPFTDLPTFDVCDASCFLGTTTGSVPSPVIDFHASVARNDPFWSVVVATLNAPWPA